MASRFKPSTRVAIAAPALVLAAALSACHPPHEKPADPNAEYTMPSYTGTAGDESGDSAEHGSEAHGAEGGEATATVTVTENAGAEGAAQQGAAGQQQGAVGQQGVAGQQGAAGQGAAGAAGQQGAGQVPGAATNQ